MKITLHVPTTTTTQRKLNVGYFSTVSDKILSKILESTTTTAKASKSSTTTKTKKTAKTTTTFHLLQAQFLPNFLGSVTATTTILKLGLRYQSTSKVALIPRAPTAKYEMATREF